MSNADTSLNPEKRDNLPGEKKVYVKPAIEEGTSLPTATATNFTNNVWD